MKRDQTVRVEPQAVSRAPHGMKLYPYDGHMLPMGEVCALTGLTRSGVATRMREGIPLEAVRQDERSLRYEFRGAMRTARFIARELGVHQRDVRRRIASGRPLDAPPQAGEERLDASRHNLRKDPIRFGGSNIFDDSKSFEQDKRAQLVRRYFANQEPVHTDAELRAEFPDLALSDAACEKIRDWLRSEMFSARKIGGREQLELVADMFDLSRERIRQVEESAIRSFRVACVELGVRDDLLTGLRAVQEARDRAKPSHWDQAEENSPGYLDLPPEFNRNRTREKALAKRRQAATIRRRKGEAA